MTRDEDLVTELQRLSTASVPAVAELAERVCLIPAPAYEEGERAAFVADQFKQLGLEPEIDEIGNVIVRRKGRGARKSLMLAAHTDTVFPRDTPLTVEHREGELVGPSIGDNSLGVAAVVELARILDAAGLETDGDLLLVANVGEEGLGNLRGIRALVDRFERELGGVIAVEGHNLGRVTHVAVGSKRIRVVVEGPGGHSWGAFGQPSAIHVLAGIVYDIAHLSVPSEPKTTFNVGVIEGGVSVNTIAPRASAIIDMRSTDAGSLATLARRVEQIVVERQTRLIKTSIELLGERPAGQTPRNALIVRTATDVLKTLGMDAELNASSTDANVPIARGIPAICIGLTHGTGAHRVDEAIEIAPIAQGMWQLALLAAAFPVD